MFLTLIGPGVLNRVCVTLSTFWLSPFLLSTFWLFDIMTSTLWLSTFLLSTLWPATGSSCSVYYRGSNAANFEMFFCCCRYQRNTGQLWAIQSDESNYVLGTKETEKRTTWWAQNKPKHFICILYTVVANGAGRTSAPLLNSGRSENFHFC